MPLTPNTKLGQYEVVESIGAGGMGEVYRARDTKLGRDVAIKVLPEEFAQDKERLDRFEREARLLAQLNHSNIATLHGLEDHDGQQFLVMELVEGETLAERIARGRLPVDEAIPLFIQIAEGLEAAHEKGIIHRDLKPANIKIGPDGKPKILDFGLAKAFVGTDESAVDSSQSPTLTKGTALGVIVGTASYMSPEQARGKVVDKRADIWAFGCCLYEALTGRKAFEGETVSDIIAAVVQRAPDWTRLPRETSRRIRQLLERCLRKDVRQRVRDIGDAWNVLAEGSVDEDVDGEQTAARKPFPLLAAVVAAAAIAGVTTWNLKTSTPASPAVMFELSLPVDSELPELNFPAVAISPDGAHIVFVARRGGVQQLYHRRMNELTARPLPGTEGARGLFFSPDSQWVGFTANAKLFKVSLSAGTVVELTDASTRGASWGPNGTIVFAETIRSGLSVISADGGEARDLTLLDPKKQEASHRWPQVLPGGKSVLFTLSTHDTETWDDAQIVAQAIGSSERRVVVDGASYGRYVSTGHVVYARAGKLFAVPFDLDRLEVTGTGVLVLENVAQFPSYGSPQLSLSDLGDLIYVSGGLRTNRLVWVDRDGKEESLSLREGAYRAPRLSPDGRDIAVVDQGPDNEVWIHGISRGTMTRLTFEANNNGPVWSPDGNSIVFNSFSVQASAANLMLAQADGSRGAEKLVTTGSLFARATSWSSDGQMLAGSSRLAGQLSDSDIWVLELDGERKLQHFLQTSFAEGSPSFSPDNRWLAYQSNETGRDEIYVQPFPRPGRKLQISTEGGTAPKWRRDGGEIFFRNGDEMMAVDVTTTPAFTPGKPKRLFEGSYEADWDVSADGRRFLSGNDEAQTKLVVVHGWSRELERLVSTN